MRFHLYKMSPQGEVAVANLLMVGTVIAVAVLTLPELAKEGVINVDRFAPWQRSLMDFLEVAMAVLTFPAGWLGIALCGPGVMVFVPLNAYLWGFVVARSTKWIRQRRKGDA